MIGRLRDSSDPKLSEFDPLFHYSSLHYITRIHWNSILNIFFAVDGAHAHPDGHSAAGSDQGTDAGTAEPDRQAVSLVQRGVLPDVAQTQGARRNAKKSQGRGQ